MWPFKKNKYNTLKRDDVVNALIELQNQESGLEERIGNISKEIEDLIQQGRKEKSKEFKLVLAKKIEDLNEEKQAASERCQFLLYNIKMMRKLKTAIDDNQFFANTGKVSLGNLLKDQKGLAKFLNKTLNVRATSEETLVGANDIFKEYEAMQDKNESIYGVNKSQDELLAIFELGEDDEFAEDAVEETIVEEERQKQKELV